MAAKGTEEKKKIFQKIMEVFPGAFFEEQDKKLRIPMKTADNEEIEIRLTLTACKDIMGGKQVEVTPTAVNTDGETGAATMDGYMNPPEDSSQWEMTKDEKEKVANLLGKLGI